MISNERPSQYLTSPSERAFQERSYGSPKPRVDESTLRRETIPIERKTFILSLKENPRGRFLRITEDVNGRRDNVIIPVTGLEEFSKILNEMVKTAGELPVKEETNFNR
jgi:hypothetical protein